MTFGTTFKDTRAKTIDATVKAIQAKHPNTKVVTAYTSHIIINRVKKNEGITFPTPEEALEQLKSIFCNHKVIMVPGCLELVRDGGALNCVTWNIKTPPPVADDDDLPL